MKHFLLIGLACLLVHRAAAQDTGQVQLQINGGVGAPITLEPGEGGSLNVYNPGWAPEAKRPQILAVTSKELSEEWSPYSFTFTPRQSGTVRLVLSAARPANGTPSQDSVSTLYDNLRADGAQIENGDFEQSDDHGEYLYWQARQRSVRQTTPTGDAALVTFGNELTQEVTVTANRPITIAFSARAVHAPSAPVVAGAEGEPPAATQAGNKQRRNRVTELRNKGEAYEGMYPPRWYMIDRDTPVPDKPADVESVQDITEWLKMQVRSGEHHIQLPDGHLRLSEAVSLPGNTSLSGSQDSRLELDAVTEPFGPIITLAGSNIRLSNIALTVSDRVLLRLLEDKREALIAGREIANVRFDRVRFALSDRQFIMARASRQRPGDDTRNMPARWPVVRIEQSSDVEVTGCVFSNFATAFEMVHTARINFDGNRGVNGLHNLMRFYHGSEYLKYNNNWTSHVKHPVVWDGGDAAHNKNLTPDEPERVDRDMKPGDPDYAGHMTGTFDVFCHNNYGEYGKTLLWGRKGRRIIMTANSARFTTDLSFDAEGCEEVVFANNISINSKAGGVGVFYSNQSTVVTGNLIVTHDVGDDVYRGEFMRIHANKDLKSHNTIVANNLFVNHLSEPRFLRVDSADSLTIEGNKFVNGGILTNPYGGGNMVVSHNTFTTDLEVPGALVRVARVVDDFTFRGNTMISTSASPDSESSAVDLAFSRGTDPGNPDGTESMFRLIEGNSFRGWGNPVSFTGAPTRSAPAPIVLVNNTFDGQLQVPETLVNAVVSGNVQIPRHRSADSNE